MSKKSALPARAREVLRLELASVVGDYKAAKASYAGARTDAEKAKYLKAMSNAAADETRIKAQLAN